MKPLRILIIGAFAMTLLHPGWVAARARPLGTIAGAVYDNTGQTISGAIVKLIDETTAGPTVRFIRANEEGSFYAKNIEPGSYRLRAEARGFLSEVKPINVRPDVVLSLRFELKRLDTLLDHRSDRNGYRWIVRGGSQPVLRHNGGDEPDIDDLPLIGEDGFADAKIVRGMIQFVGGIPLSDYELSRSFGGLNIAVAGHAAANLEMVFVGQVSSDYGYPARLEFLASTFATDEHKLTARVGYSRLMAYGVSGTPQSVGQMSLALLDSWQVRGPLVVVYGMDVSRYQGTGSQWTVSPRIGVNLAANGATRLTADYFPVSSQEIRKQGQFDYEGGEITFSDPQQLALVGDQVQPEHNRRLQFGVERRLDQDSSIEAAVFFDQFAGCGVGLLSVPSDVVGLKPTWQNVTQQGQARGARIMYRRELTSFLTGVIGYSAGQGQRINPEGMNPSELFGSSPFQVVSVRLDADVSRTGTRISSTYRLGSRHAAYAIDPFYGRLDVFDPNLNVMVTQEIPDLGLLPGRWEATVDARNLLDQQETASLDGNAVVLGPSHRTIRGSVSVRF